MQRRSCMIYLGSAALIILILLTCASVIQDPEKIQLDEATRAGLPGQFIHLPGGVTHYTFTGPSGGQVVVLVHGFSVAAYSWERNIPELIQAGNRVLAYDLYGRGYSDRPAVKYDLQLFIDQLDQLLTALKIDQPVDIAGISMGGYITAGFAAQYPQRVHRIILLAPQVEATRSDSRLLPVVIPVLGDVLFTLYIGPYVMADSQDEFKDYMPSSDWHDRYLDMMKYKGFRRSLISTLCDMNGDPLIEYRQLDRQNIPVMLLWGDKDSTIPVENSQLDLSAIPKAQFHLIPGARHASIYERPEVVNPYLVAFFNQP